MKKILFILFILTGFIANAQTYSPTTAIPSNKPWGSAQGTPTESRSMFFDGTNFLWRSYSSTAEVLSYLNLAKYRTGQFPIFVHSGGVLNGNGTYTGGINIPYWFKDGTLDANLVLYHPSIYNINDTLTTARTLYGGVAVNPLSFSGIGAFNVNSANNYFGSVAGSASVGMTLNYTDAIKLPGGTTGQRPTGALGLMRFNSTLGIYEIYNPNTASWDQFGADTLNISTEPITLPIVRIAPRIAGNTEFFPAFKFTGGITGTKGTDSSITIDGSGISAGNVVINNPVISGVVTRILYTGTGGTLQQSPNLVYDSTNNRVGVGPGTPSTLFHVRANTSQTAEVKIESQTAAQPARITMASNSINWQMTHEGNSGGGSGNMNLDFAYNGASKVSFLNGGGVLINTTTPVASAALVVGGTTQGVLIPRLTGTQQNAISSPATGLIIYNTDSTAFTYYNGTAWLKIGSGGGSVLTQFSVQGDGTSGNKIQLVNDQNTPGANKVYGTDGSGTKNWVITDTVVDWSNVVTAGADPTGTTDIAPVINALLTAGKRYIYFPRGNYKLSSTIILKDSVTWKGAGPMNSTIVLTTNITAFHGISTSGFKNQFLDLGFKGTFGGTGNTSQQGIVLDTLTGCYIHNCHFFFMAGFDIVIRGNGLLSGSDFADGNRVTDNYSQTNYGFCFLDVRGEYNSILGNTQISGTYGVLDKGGNNRISNNNFTLAAYGMYFDAGDNDGHGIAVGNTLNHCGTAGIYCNGLVFGFTFESNNLFASNLTIVSSDRVDIIGGKMSGVTITLTSATNCNINTPDFVSAPTLSITTSTGVMIENIIGGLRVTNWANPTAPFSLTAQNTIVNYGGTASGSADGNTTRHNFFQQVTGIGGSPDGNNRAFYGNSFRFENNGSSTFGNDPHVVYHSGGTNNTFTVWNNNISGLYDFLVDASGNVGIRTGSPTAYLHIHAGNATASNAPLKIDSGVVLTSPEKYAIENNGTHFYWTDRTATRRQLDQQPSIYTADGTATSRTVTISGFLDFSGANTGFGTTTPRQQVDILGTLNPQLRLSYTDNSVYTDFQVTSGGTLGITPTGTNSIITKSGTANQYIGIGGSFFDVIADAGNTSTTETDLYSNTTPANFLTTDGQKIDFKFEGIYLGSTSSKAVQIYFGGTSIFNSGALAISSNSVWEIKGYIIRTSSTTARCFVSLVTPGLSVNMYDGYTALTGLNFTTTNIFKITGQASAVGAATNDIVLKMGTGEWKPTAPIGS